MITTSHITNKNLQSLEIETEQIVLFWDILWYRNFVCMNCELYLGLQCACKPSWPTGFEKSKIHQPNPEKLQVGGSKIGAFLLDFREKCWKLIKNASILHPSTCNFSALGWWILDFSKPVGQEGLLAHSEPKWVSQFMQLQSLIHREFLFVYYWNILIHF